MSQVKKIVRSKWDNLTDNEMILVQGNHDPADTKGLAKTGPLEYEDFIVYVINEDDYPSKQGDSSVRSIVEKTTNDLIIWLEQKEKAGETRPIFIATHTGLHYDIDRADGNNQYAYILFDAINEAAKKLDIIFLFGHNHTNGDELVGGSLTCYTKGDKIGVCTENSIAKRSGSYTVLNFTYMNYGYVGYIGDIYNNPSTEDPINTLAVTEWSLYDNHIDVKRYNSDGVITEKSVSLRKDHQDVLNYDPQYTLSYQTDSDTSIDTCHTIQSQNTVSRTTPVKEDAVFKYWSTKPDGTGNTYQPGDSIYVDKDTILYAQYETQSSDNTAAYHLTDQLTPGHEYLLLWNSEFYTNAGTYYALTDGTSNVTTIDASWISSDKTTIQLPKISSLAAIRWDVTYNTDSNPGKGYMIQNIATKNFLKNVNSEPTFAQDPTTAWQDYFWTYKTNVTGENNNTVDQLVPNSDTTRFLRYSVGSKKLKFGKTSTSTDPRNSHVYLYEKEDNTENVWEKADQIDSNNEYLIVSGNTAGNARAMTIQKRNISETDVTINQDEEQNLYVEYEAAYNDPAVVHSYQVRDGEYWLSTWNYKDFADADAGAGEVIYLKDGKSVAITGNHFDSRYYTRFAYDNGVLTAYKGTSGSDTSASLTYDNGFKANFGQNVTLFKRRTNDTEIIPHMHVFGDYTSDNNATCIVDGTQSAICDCGVIDTKPLKESKLDHQYKYDETVSPTDTYHSLKCTLCKTQQQELHYTETEGKTTCDICGIQFIESSPKLPFTDVEKGIWFYDAVKYNYENKIMTGLTDESFGPYEKLARAQFAVILYRMNEEPEIEYSERFPDIADNTWYTNAILWSAQNQIVTGYTDTGLFGPADNITREQMAVMMYRYAVNFKGQDAENLVDLDQFKDASAVSSFAKEAMQWAVGNGIITGKDNGTRLDPQASASRAECAIIIQRFIEKFGK